MKYLVYMSQLAESQKTTNIFFLTWCLISLVQFTLAHVKNLSMIFLILMCMYFTLTEIPYNGIILIIHSQNRFWNYEECSQHRVLIFNIKKWKPVEDSKYSTILGKVSKLLTSQGGITSQEVRWHNIPGSLNLLQHWCQNFKSRIIRSCPRALVKR
jgi:hypothetical protein